MTKNETNKEFQCRRCGTCCRWSGHVLLTEDDISRLSSAMNISDKLFIDRYTVLAANRRQLSLSEHPDGRCIFLEDDRCLRYEARPDQCRNFPHSWRVSKGCPALDKSGPEPSHE